MGIARMVGDHRRLAVRLKCKQTQQEELLALKTTELHLANQQLKKEIHSRLTAEKDLHKLNVELEKRVAERTSILQAANRELESFCFAVSHELRSPLTSIIGFSNALVDDCGPDLGGRSRQYLERIVAASVRMQGEIDAMLKFSRLTLSNLTITAVDLSELALEIGRELAQAKPRGGVELVIDERLTAKADRILIRTVLENLLGNAWKYTGKKEKAVIEFGASEQNGETIYFVADNGAGFNMEYADKLFEPFQRLHRIDEFEGNGIGLMTVKRIIRHHGGKIWAEAAVEKGATFYFTIGYPQNHEI